jgi:hypothetical protein
VDRQPTHPEPAAAEDTTTEEAEYPEYAEPQATEGADDTEYERAASDFAEELSTDPGEPEPAEAREPGEPAEAREAGEPVEPDEPAQPEEPEPGEPVQPRAVEVAAVAVDVPGATLDSAPTAEPPARACADLVAAAAQGWRTSSGPTSRAGLTVESGAWQTAAEVAAALEDYGRLSRFALSWPPAPRRL